MVQVRSMREIKKVVSFKNLPVHGKGFPSSKGSSFKKQFGEPHFKGRHKALNRINKAIRKGRQKVVGYMDELDWAESRVLPGVRVGKEEFEYHGEG